MSTDVSQVGVVLFPSFLHFLSKFVILLKMKADTLSTHSVPLKLINPSSWEPMCGYAPCHIYIIASWAFNSWLEGLI